MRNASEEILNGVRATLNVSIHKWCVKSIRSVSSLMQGG